MAGKAGKHNPEDSRLGTFNIKHQTWQDFLQLCGEHKTSATKALVSFIESCVESQSIPDNTAILTPDIDSLIDGKLESITAAIAGLGERLAVLEEQCSEPVKTKPKAKAKQPTQPKQLPEGVLTKEEMIVLSGLDAETISVYSSTHNIKLPNGITYHSPYKASHWIPGEVEGKKLSDRSQPTIENNVIKP
jgi:hypothetical protein